MSKLFLILTMLWVACSSAIAADDKPLLFLNRSGETLVRLQFSPPGMAKWGVDQCQYEEDKSVEHNEKIPLKDVSPGRYDLRFMDIRGRTCIVKNLEVKAGALVVIREAELPPECLRNK